MSERGKGSSPPMARADALREESGRLRNEAMSNPIGPHIPARPEWLHDAIVPVHRRTQDGSHAVLDASCGAGPYLMSGQRIALCDVFLDLTRPEVRDLLVRRGAPAWARDIPAALRVWAMTGAVRDCLHPICKIDAFPVWVRDSRSGAGSWNLARCDVAAADGEDFAAAFARHAEAADRAALAHGCILTEPGGYIVPTPEGPGWWPKEQA